MDKTIKKIKVVILAVIAFLVVYMMGVTIYYKIYLNKDNNKDNLHGTVSFISNRTDKRSEILQLIEEFNEIYPNIKVDLELIGDAEDILQRKASVGELADVTLVPGSIADNELANYFIPIDDLGFKEEDIYDYYYGLGDDNKLYKLTTTINFQCVIYNKEIFKEAGIVNTPNTIDEFYDVCEKLKEYGVNPVSINYKQPWIISMWKDSIPRLLDIDLEESVTNGENNLIYDGGGIYKSLNFLRTLIINDYCEEDLMNSDWEQSKYNIKDGKSAMIIWNSGFVNQLQDIGMNIENIGVFPIPESQQILFTGDYRYAISKTAKYPDAAKAFLKFLFEDDRYAEAVNILSPLKSNKDTKNLFTELEKYDIPINIESQVSEEETYDEKIISDLYYNNINKVKYNDDFVQEYCISKNSNEVKELIDNINSRWNDIMSK